MALQPQSKRRKLAPRDENKVRPSSNKAAKNRKASSDGLLKNVSFWDLEQDYESRPHEVKHGNKEKSRLPVKSEYGLIQPHPEPSGGSDDNGSFLGTDSNDAGNAPGLEDDQVDVLSSREETMQAQEELARIADLINQDPEEHITGLKTLAKFSHSKSSAIKKLALVTQLAVFKDIIPGYRIKPRGEDALQEKLSKDVKRLRTFEQGLVSAYQDYVRALAATAKPPKDSPPEILAVSKVALSCICQLLLAVPHFNFRGELLKPLVSKLGGRKTADSFRRCISTFEQLFREDEDGNASREAVGMIAQTMKSKNYDVDESVVSTFLHLRLLTQLSVKGSKDGIDRGDKDRALNGKRAKQRKDFVNKKQRKARKELKEIEKEFAEADTTVQYEEREKMQAETLKIVFATYFRILKTRSAKLEGAVLEGLARYAHLINQDFFGDLLVTLQELAQRAVASMDNDNDAGSDDDEEKDIKTLTYAPSKANPLRSALLCTTTAFALLSSQEAATLSLDLSSFVHLLHALLIPLSNTPDLELSHKTPRLADPHSPHASQPLAPNKVNATALSTLLVRALSAALAPRSTPPVRLAALAHRLMMCALQVPEKTALAVVALVREIAKNHGRKVRGIWSTEEQRGDGRFDPLGGLENSRPFCGTVWEGELLRLHFANGVREGMGDLEMLVRGMR